MIEVEKSGCLRPRSRRVVIEACLNNLFKFAEDRKSKSVDKICDQLGVRYFRHNGVRYKHSNVPPFDNQEVKKWPSLRGQERKDFNQFIEWYDAATEPKDRVAYGLGKLLDYSPDIYSLYQLLPKELHSGFKVKNEHDKEFNPETSLSDEQIAEVKKKCTHLFELIMQVKLMQGVLTKL